MAGDKAVGGSHAGRKRNRVVAAVDDGDDAAAVRAVGGKRHVCETCGKAFAQSGSLASHIRTHSEENPYVCETCGKAFSSSRSLATHMQRHSGDI